MKINDLPLEFRQALPVMDIIMEHHYEAYFVGGSVRDVILGHTIHDVDIATSAFPQEIKEMFPRTIDVGIDHGTVLVLYENDQYEITTFRTESTYQDYRRPDSVTFVRSLEEDLKRRDFTMNALAMTCDGDVIDLFDGIQSIHQKEIKAVGNPDERFSEDALRMMRALRFASQLDFDIEKETEQAILKNHQLLDKIAIERIYIEWVKLLMGQQRARGIVPFVETKCFEYCPGLKDKKDELLVFAQQSPNKLLTSEELAWSCLLVAINISDVKMFLSKWKTSKRLTNLLDSVMYYYTKRLTKSWSAKELYQAGVDVISLVEETREFFGLTNEVKQCLTAYEKLPIKSIADLAVSGRDVLAYLEKKPGPWLGDTLKHAEYQVVEGYWQNDKKYLLEKIKEREGGTCDEL